MLNVPVWSIQACFLCFHVVIVTAGFIWCLRWPVVLVNVSAEMQIKTVRWCKSSSRVVGFRLNCHICLETSASRKNSTGPKRDCFQFTAYQPTCSFIFCHTVFSLFILPLTDESPAASINIQFPCSDKIVSCLSSTFLELFCAFFIILWFLHQLCCCLHHFDPHPALLSSFTAGLSVSDTYRDECWCQAQASAASDKFQA